MSIIIKNHRQSDDTFSVNRMTYNAVTKRNVSSTIGTIKIGEEIPASITSEMTKPEIAEMTYQWSEIKQSVRKVELSDVTDKLVSVCNETLESVALDAVSPDNAKNVLKLLDATRKALRAVIKASEPAPTPALTTTEIVEPEKEDQNSSSSPEPITTEQTENNDAQEEKEIILRESDFIVPEENEKEETIKQENSNILNQNILTDSSGYWNRRN